MLIVKIPKDSNKLEKQIQALELLIHQDTNDKDMRIHMAAYRALLREQMDRKAQELSLLEKINKCKNLPEAFLTLVEEIENLNKRIAALEGQVQEQKNFVPEYSDGNHYKDSIMCSDPNNDDLKHLFKGEKTYP